MALLISLQLICCDFCDQNIGNAKIPINKNVLSALLHKYILLLLLLWLLFIIFIIITIIILAGEVSPYVISTYNYN